MTLVMLLVAAILVGVAIFAATAFTAWRRFRGRRVVVCPDDHRTAAVEVDASGAAVSAMLGGKDLRLQSCSQWPEKEGCGQECLAQIQAAPEDTLVTSVLQRWYTERQCVICKLPIEFHTLEHRPAMMDLSRADRPTIVWEQIDPTELPERLKTLAPVCWNCHIAETFRRTRPELVIDRPPHAGPAERL